MTFASGWLDGIYHRDAHPGRVGGPITPFGPRASQEPR